VEVVNDGLMRVVTPGHEAGEVPVTLIDAGGNYVDIDPLAVGIQFLPDTDLAGQPRVTDGNGDGQSVIDVGAYELQIAGTGM
jgi:hypothetical protein